MWRGRMVLRQWNVRSPPTPVTSFLVNMVVIRETCTSSPGQVNVCWSNKYDVLSVIGAPVLNRTYSSLSSANPDATAWSFNPQSLIAATDTTSQLSTSTSSSTSSSTSTNTHSST